MRLDEKNLIMDLAAGVISRIRFYELYPVDIINDDGYVLRKLKVALLEKDQDKLEHMLYLRGFHSSVEPLLLHQDVLLEILLGNWHSVHEMVLDHIQIKGDGRVVQYICALAIRKFPYLDEEDNISLAVKCVYALSKVGSPVAIEKVRGLCKDNRCRVRDAAKQELVRLRKCRES